MYLALWTPPPPIRMGLAMRLFTNTRNGTINKNQALKSIFTHGYFNLMTTVDFFKNIRNLYLPLVSSHFWKNSTILIFRFHPPWLAPELLGTVQFNLYSTYNIS